MCVCRITHLADAGRLLIFRAESWYAVLDETAGRADAGRRSDERLGSADVLAARCWCWCWCCWCWCWRELAVLSAV